MPVGAKCADGHRSCCKTDPKISVYFVIVTDNVTFRIFGLTAENAREGKCREKGGNASGKGRKNKLTEACLFCFFFEKRPGYSGRNGESGFEVVPYELSDKSEGRSLNGCNT